MSTQPTSPFLSLPYELRLAIYGYALSPTGLLHLTSSETHRFCVTPTIAPALLATNRQIHAEATPLLYDANEICLTVNAHDTCWPLISDALIGPHALETLTRLFLILDCVGGMRTSYADVEFTPLEALVGLRGLRVAVLEAEGERNWGMQSGVEGENVLGEVLRRVPRGVEVVLGTEEGSPQREVVESVIAGKMKGNKRRIAEVAREVLEEAARAVPDEVKGMLSGGTKDVFLDGIHTDTIAWSR